MIIPRCSMKYIGVPFLTKTYCGSTSGTIMVLDGKLVCCFLRIPWYVQKYHGTCSNTLYDHGTIVPINWTCNTMVLLEVSWSTTKIQLYMNFSTMISVPSLYYGTATVLDFRDSTFSKQNVLVFFSKSVTIIAVY